MTKELFGTDGIRGIPGTYPLDDATLYGVARALGKYLLESDPKPHVLIGMDTRESGPHIASQLAAGLADDGVEFLSAGVISTPGIACLVRRKKFSAGMVISASHNPFHDNGVKLFAGSGMKFPDDVEEHLEIEIHEHKGRDTKPHGIPVRVDKSLDEEYLTYLRGRIIHGANLANLKLVLDCANGAASQLAPALFESLGANVIAIHDQPNGRNINDACGSLHPETLREKVLEAGAHLGVAFDGDADRAMFVSASGQHVDGDGVLLAMARYLKSCGELRGDRVIGTTMANLGLERALHAEGLALARMPVGDRYVLEEMLRSGSNLGGEQSGHIIFLDDATTGDGMLTALKIACLVSLRGPLDQLIHGFKVFP
ncbi:MAG: phosphoglucosamine mutase, partial [Candidatus Acidiferrales bacterium]